MLLSVAKEKSHDILCGRKGQGMLGSPVSVAVNSGTQTIQFHTLRQIFQSLLSNSVKEFKHPNAHRFALVCEGCVALLTIIILVTCYCGDGVTGVHSSHKLTHDDHIQLSRSQLNTRCPELLYVAQ